MTEFALKTEVEIFENASRLLIVCPNLLYLLTQVLRRRLLLIYSGPGLRNLEWYLGVTQ